MEKQDARLNARENKLKESRKRIRHGTSINSMVKNSPRKKTNYFSKEELQREFPTFTMHNVEFYTDVMVDFLRAHLGIVSKESISSTKFADELKVAD